MKTTSYSNSKESLMLLSLEKERDTSDDISKYVRNSLTQIALSKELEPWAEESEIQELLQWSGHLFIAAATACRYLRLGSFPEDTLREFLEAKRTMDDDDPLDNMYNLLLQSAAAAAAGPDKKRFPKLYPLVVGAILVSKEPMSRRDMEEILGLSTREIEFILNHLLCVLIVPQERQASVRLFHLSFRDYLVNRERCQDLRFLIDESEAHKRSFEYYFGHLSSELKENIHQYHPGTPISEMSQHKVSRVIQYCSQYWVSHLTEAGENSLDTFVSKRILEFLHEHLLHWIETCTIIGRIDDAVHSLENLKALASVSGVLIRIHEIVEMAN
ncbi:hypothetical protein N7488_012067 [Penicillium malachiteum]|nr:hypothetical protein N7488_012067 [Penicillium malachiteum]